jgi:hypothetical protein
MAFVINPEFGTPEIAVAAGVRMLKNPNLTMSEILNFIDSEMIVEVADKTSDVEIEAVTEVNDIEIVDETVTIELEV